MRYQTQSADSQGLLLFEDEEAAARRAAIDELHVRTAIYTASPVVDDLLKRLGWPDGNGRLVDPSCGDGMFLARALAALLAARPSGFDPRGQIEGWEIHPAACVDARSRVAAVLASHGWSPARAAMLANDMVHNRDFLTDGPTTPQWDIVAGNPPYLRAANVPDLLRNEYSRHVPDYARGDMLHSFLERCSRTVRPAGRIGLVTADRWMVNAGASRLRERLGQRLSLAHVERLSAETAFYRPKQRRAGSPPRVHPVSVVLVSDDGAGQNLSGKPIHPGVDESRYEGMQLLGDFADVRIAPWLGTEGVFVVDAATARGLPPECLVPAIDTDDIQNGKLGTPTRWAIRTRPGEEPAPEVMAHLKSRMHLMAKRGRQGKVWMPPESFHALDLSRESLIVPRIAKTPRAVRVPPGILPINHNLSIVAGGAVTLDQVEEALASPIAAEWVRDYAQRLEGGYLSLTTTLLRRMPMANVAA
ncbi:Eco57I restriction-modification methylase domain-containing protein [Burkholderia stabilis]|uniref:Eco57I restriction-modification methylase domain-containing protein n=1 Tax=Burkholderia stabilis TaxID=95485 RepID=UPI001F4B88D0|nr:N-6 DNA methylase [Burkholderia stabilis]